MGKFSIFCGKMGTFSSFVPFTPLYTSNFCPKSLNFLKFHMQTTEIYVLAVALVTLATNYHICQRVGVALEHESRRIILTVNPYNRSTVDFVPNARSYHVEQWIERSV